MEGYLYIIIGILVIAVIGFIILSIKAARKTNHYFHTKEEYERALSFVKEHENVSKDLQELRKILDEKEEALVECKLLVNSINNEIKEKQEFNSSLQKIREDELNRLIEQQKVEKLNVANLEILTLKNAWMTEVQEQIDDWSKSAQEAATFQRDEIMEEIGERREELQQLNGILDEARLRTAAIAQAIKREKEIEEQQDYYRIVISDNDIEDIQMLQDISYKIKNREAVAKLIYDVYVSRPLTEMIKRVLGLQKISGIYKITYLKTGEAYIGKSTDVPSRWKAHMKTVCGLDGAAHQTVHTMMQNKGFWNFSFELLEEVPKDKLSEREKFYIDLYNTKEQLNMKEGG